MTTSRKFYRLLVPVEILSEESPPATWGLDEIHEAITTGDCSGRIVSRTVCTLGGLATARALMAQGSDPEFFSLTRQGGDLM